MGVLVSRPKPTYLLLPSLKEPDVPETTSLLCNKSRAGNEHSHNLQAAITELTAAAGMWTGPEAEVVISHTAKRTLWTRAGSPVAPFKTLLGGIWPALPRSAGRTHGCKGGAVEAPDGVVVWDVYGCRDTVKSDGREDILLEAGIRHWFLRSPPTLGEFS